MSKGSVAKSRRSQLITTYGVGALFPAQSESFMIMGLEDWTADAPEITEPRLARALQVHRFKAPPAGGSRDIPVIRFPEWFYCPQCRRLGNLRSFDSHWTESRCANCRADLVPSRFVICCPRGHIDDFPYFRWLHRGQQTVGEHRMSLTTRGQSSSLADIVINCTCGMTPTTMEDSFRPQALNWMKCQGRRPWLGADSREECPETPRTLQRGSSNVWFPVTRSAISIPPWSEGAYRILDKHWAVLTAVPIDAIAQTIQGMQIANDAYSVEDLTNAVLRRRGYEDEAVSTDAGEVADDLRPEEYRALCEGRKEESRDQDFVCTPSPIDPIIAPWVAQVSKVSRLREVRAVKHFTRIQPPSAETPAEHLAPLSKEPMSWLPALEVIGEGIFIRLDESRLNEWEQSGFARERAGLMQRALDQRDAERPMPMHPTITPRQLLLHSLAHALIDQLSLDAGYPAASLRERVYAEEDMAGILIYTATSDSAGSLGGVAAQAAPDRFAQAFQEAASRMSWCSSDPVCIESVASGVDAFNLAACHSCLLLPETSCEHNNIHLDRATLVGRPDAPEAGFLSELLMAY